MPKNDVNFYNTIYGYMVKVDIRQKVEVNLVLYFIMCHHHTYSCKIFFLEHEKSNQNSLPWVQY